MTMKQEHYINGQWVAGTGNAFQSIDPADASLVWEAKAAGPEQVDAALKAARKAFPAWANSSLEYRLDIIKKFAEKVKENTDLLATLISRETGKPFWETKTEVATTIGKVGISEKSYHERTGTKATAMPAIGGSNVSAHLRHRPHGVVAVFGPYNFPAHLPNGHIVPALIAGNTIVLKPSEQTPAVSDLIIQLWQAAGLPDGVLNLVQGEKETSIALANHDELDGLFFTGSPEVGHILHKAYAGHPGKILALEMGGNNPLLVSDKTQDLDAVIHEIVQSAFLSAGQRCTCARRLLVPNNAHGEAILAKLIEVTKGLKIDRFDAQDQPFMGPLVSAQAADNIATAFARLVGLGADTLLAAERGEANTGFISPGILDVTELAAKGELPDEEYFGPLLTVVRYDDMDQAMSLANATKFGLSAGILSDDKTEYEWFLQHSRAGIINWNRQTTGAAGTAPFGGTGASGNHRSSAYYAADYCSYPVSSIEVDALTVPETLVPGIAL